MDVLSNLVLLDLACLAFLNTALYSFLLSRLSFSFFLCYLKFFHTYSHWLINNFSEVYLISFCLIMDSACFFFFVRFRSRITIRWRNCALLFYFAKKPLKSIHVWKLSSFWICHKNDLRSCSWIGQSPISCRFFSFFFWWKLFQKGWFKFVFKNIFCFFLNVSEKNFL